jgi:hypothetical protein
MRRNTFETARDDHVSMQEVLDQIEVRAQAAASSTVNDMIAREQEMAMMPGGSMGQSGITPMMGQGGVPPTLSQEYLQFVDGTDEVPEWIKRKYWGIITRMNQLTQIKDERELARMEASIRAMIRPFVWKTKVTSEEMFMIQHYTKTQVLKALGGKERRLIAPTLTEITRKEEYQDNSVLSRNQNPGMVRGAIDTVFGR